MLARAGDSETFVVKQPLDFENRLDVFAAIEAMAARALHWLKRGEFGFPVAQHESLGSSDAANFADAKQALRRQCVQDGSGSSHVYSYRRLISASVNTRIECGCGNRRSYRWRPCRLLRPRVSASSAISAGVHGQIHRDGLEVSVRP